MSAEIYIFPSREPAVLKGGASLEYEPDTVTQFPRKSFIRWEAMGPGWWFCLGAAIFYLWSLT